MWKTFPIFRVHLVAAFVLFSFFSFFSFFTFSLCLSTPHPPATAYTHITTTSTTMADDPYPPDDMLYYAIANGVEWMEKRCALLRFLCLFLSFCCCFRFCFCFCFCFCVLLLQMHWSSSPLGLFTHMHTRTHTQTHEHTHPHSHTHAHAACCSHPGSLSFFFFSLGTIVIIRIRAALDSDDTEHKLLKLTPEQRYAICREAAKKVSGGDISPYIDKTMPPLGKEGLSAWCRAAGMTCLHAFQSVRCWLQAHPFAFSPRCCPLPLVRVCAFSNL